MQPHLKVRRARRDDFERVRALLGTHAPAVRADRKRFRRLVSTLREDCYLAARGDDPALVGLAVIVYARGLGPPTAVVRRLFGTSEAATALLDCARARAAARGCTRLEVQLGSYAIPVAAGSPAAVAAGTAPTDAGPPATASAEAGAASTVFADADAAATPAFAAGLRGAGWRQGPRTLVRALDE